MATIFSTLAGFEGHFGNHASSFPKKLIDLSKGVAERESRTVGGGVRIPELFFLAWALELASIFAGVV